MKKKKHEHEFKKRYLDLETNEMEKFCECGKSLSEDREELMRWMSKHTPNLYEQITPPKKEIEKLEFEGIGLGPIKESSANEIRIRQAMQHDKINEIIDRLNTLLNTQDRV